MKKITTGLFLAIAFAAAVLVYSNPEADASPAVSCYDTTSFDSTSTRTFLSPGAGTTTLLLSNCASGNLADSAFVQFQYTASSSVGKLNIRVEHSNNKVDWYPETTTITGNATTTIMAGDSLVYQFNMATTTDQGGTGAGMRLHRSLPITTPTKFTRVIFYVPTGGNNGALWAEVVGRKQF